MQRKYKPSYFLKIHVIKSFIWTRYCASYAKPILVIKANMLLMVLPQCMYQPEMSNHILERSTSVFKTVKHLQSSFTFGLGNSAFLGIKIPNIFFKYVQT